MLHGLLEDDYFVVKFNNPNPYGFINLAIAQQNRSSMYMYPRKVIYKHKKATILLRDTDGTRKATLRVHIDNGAVYPGWSLPEGTYFDRRCFDHQFVAFCRKYGIGKPTEPVPAAFICRPKELRVHPAVWQNVLYTTSCCLTSYCAVVFWETLWSAVRDA